MKTIIRYMMMLIGCFLIAFGIDYLLVPNNLISFGVDGIGLLLNYKVNIPTGLTVLLLSFIFIALSAVFFKNKEYKRYILPSIIIPVLIYLFKDVYSWYPIVLPEIALTLLVAGFIIGTGYTLIYKQGFAAGGTLLLEELLCHLIKFHSKFYSYILDGIIVIIYIISSGYEVALYSSLVIIITRFMIARAKFGISDSKMFYIITSKEKEVKHFILHDLHGELSVLDSQGGYSKKDNKIFLCVIPTSEYYKLKEGIKIIDSKAFIAITDTYDVVNRKSF